MEDKKGSVWWVALLAMLTVLAVGILSFAMNTKEDKMMKGDTMMEKDGTMANEGENMMKDGAMMEKDGVMTNEGDKMMKGDSMSR